MIEFQDEKFVFWLARRQFWTTAETRGLLVAESGLRELLEKTGVEHGLRCWFKYQQDQFFSAAIKKYGENPMESAFAAGQAEMCERFYTHLTNFSKWVKMQHAEWHKEMEKEEREEEEAEL